MTLPISRTTYIESKDPETGRGMTYDLFEMLYNGMIEVKESIIKINGKVIDCEKRIKVIEEKPEKKTGAAVIADKILTKPKSAIIVILAIGLAFGIGFGFVSISDINVANLLK